MPVRKAITLSLQNCQCAGQFLPKIPAIQNCKGRLLLNDSSSEDEPINEQYVNEEANVKSFEDEDYQINSENEPASEDDVSLDNEEEVSEPDNAQKTDAFVPGPSKETRIDVDGRMKSAQDALSKLKEFVKNAINVVDIKFNSNLNLNSTMLDTRVTRLEKIMKESVVEARAERRAIMNLLSQMNVRDALCSETVKGANSRNAGVAATEIGDDTDVDAKFLRSCLY
ncbi:hypothetical protein Sjap_026248 [Stephania japonica]|uniref:Uncharacterized protein n=1 Tax=Stephania japonica TaxID=461633 RepID=A0AAP0E6N5_9MAGN